MRKEHEQHIGFRLDDDKNYKENCKAFLDAVKVNDPEMAAILRDNWDALVAVVQEGERDSGARGEFNSQVASALDALVKPPVPKDGA